MSSPVRLLNLVLLAALAGCAGQSVRTPIVATTPVLVKETQRVYVPIDPQLTAPIAIPEGPLSMCPLVASERRGVIETLEARMLEISHVQGTAVPAVGTK